MRTLLVLLMLCGVAHAGDLRFGKTTGGAIGRVKTAAMERDRLWTIEVISASKDLTEVVIEISVPHELAITNLTMTSKWDSEPLVGEEMFAGEAREHYEKIVERSHDPALLEHVASTATHETLRLRVFPIAKDQPATITLFGARGGTSLVTQQQSLIARTYAWKPTLAHVTNERSLGASFHERQQTLPPPSRLLAGGSARAARPQRAVNRSLVQIVADQDKLRAPRRVAPRIAVAEGGADAGALDEPSPLVPREMYEAFRANKARSK